MKYNTNSLKINMVSEQGKQPTSALLLFDHSSTFKMAKDNPFGSEVESSQVLSSLNMSEVDVNPIKD